MLGRFSLLDTLYISKDYREEDTPKHYGCNPLNNRYMNTIKFTFKNLTILCKTDVFGSITTAHVGDEEKEDWAFPTILSLRKDKADVAWRGEDLGMLVFPFEDGHIEYHIDGFPLRIERIKE